MSMLNSLKSMVGMTSTMPPSMNASAALPMNAPRMNSSTVPMNSSTVPMNSSTVPMNSSTVPMNSSRTPVRNGSSMSALKALAPRVKAPLSALKALTPGVKAPVSTVKAPASLTTLTMQGGRRHTKRSKLSKRTTRSKKTRRSRMRR